MALFSLMSKRDGVYYFRQRVPKDLVHLFGNEIRVSTKMKNPVEAKRLVKDFAVGWDIKFKAARNGTLEHSKAHEVAMPASTATIIKASKQDAPTLSELLPEWKKLNNPAPNSELEWKKSVERFEQLHGKLPVTRITEEHVLEYRDALYTVPNDRRLSTDFKQLYLQHKEFRSDYKKYAPATINKNLTAISSILNVAVDKRIIRRNPALRIHAKEKHKNQTKRLPFTTEDLNKIFNSPLYTGYHSADKRHIPGNERVKDAKYWLPLMALCTGARLEELGQLRIEDIVSNNNIACISISPHGEGQSLKTTNSERIVPIHNELLRCGFLNYVDSIRETGAERLFPDLPLADKDTYTQPISKWFTRFRRNVGVTHEKKTFHSFRHTVKDMMHEAGLHDEPQDRLLGHSSGRIGSRYGSGPSLVKLNEAVQQLVIPVSLKHLHDAIKHELNPSPLETILSQQVSVPEQVSASEEEQPKRITAKEAIAFIWLPEAYNRLGKAWYGRDWKDYEYCLEHEGVQYLYHHNKFSNVHRGTPEAQPIKSAVAFTKDLKVASEREIDMHLQISNYLGKVLGFSGVRKIASLMNKPAREMPAGFFHMVTFPANYFLESVVADGATLYRVLLSPQDLQNIIHHELD